MTDQDVNEDPATETGAGDGAADEDGPTTISVPENLGQAVVYRPDGQDVVYAALVTRSGGTDVVELTYFGDGLPQVATGVPKGDVRTQQGVWSEL